MILCCATLIPPHSTGEPARRVSDDGGQQWGLERGELKELKERNKSLEKECVVYRNQLKVHVGYNALFSG